MGLTSNEDSNGDHPIMTEDHNPELSLKSR